MAKLDPRIFIPHFLRDAGKGHPESARVLAGYVATYLECGVTMPPELSAWLAQAMRAVHFGADAGKALGTKGRRGHQYDPETASRNLSIAYDVFSLTAEGESQEEAWDTVAQQHGVSESTVRDAFREWREAIEADCRLWREEISDSQKP